MRPREDVGFVPGDVAMGTGGTPRSHGRLLRDGYDLRCAPATGACVPGPTCRAKQNLDVRAFSLRRQSIVKCPRPADGLHEARVAHQFPRVKNVFGLVKAGVGYGGRTAWSDKHPAYRVLNGPMGPASTISTRREITAPQV